MMVLYYVADETVWEGEGGKMVLYYVAVTLIHETFLASTNYNYLSEFVV